MPPHLTFVIDNLIRAGTQTVLLRLVEGLAPRGYEQCILCLNERLDAGMVSALETAGARVEIIGKRRLMRGAGLVHIARTLRRSDILQTLLPFSDLLGRSIGRLAGVPVIVTSIRARNIDKPGWHRTLDRLTMRWADRVVFNARSVVPFSQSEEGVRPEQVVVIPNGVRVPAEPRRDRSALAGIVPPDMPVIGTVGRLRPQKGHDVLLRAFAALAGEMPAHLVIVGDGVLREHLEAWVRERKLAQRVHFLGVRSDLPELYAAFDVYAHASVFEGMPNAVMEAMAAGLPVVATAADGTAELIESGRTGLLVPVNDSDALAAAMANLVNEPEAGRRMGKAAAAALQAGYSIERMVESFDRLYMELFSAADRARPAERDRKGPNSGAPEGRHRE